MLFCSLPHSLTHSAFPPPEALPTPTTQNRGLCQDACSQDSENYALRPSRRPQWSHTLLASLQWPAVTCGVGLLQAQGREPDTIPLGCLGPWPWFLSGHCFFGDRICCPEGTQCDQGWPSWSLSLSWNWTRAGQWPHRPLPWRRRVGLP